MARTSFRLGVTFPYFPPPSCTIAPPLSLRKIKGPTRLEPPPTWRSSYMRLPESRVCLFPASYRKCSAPCQLKLSNVRWRPDQQSNKSRRPAGYHPPKSVQGVHDRTQMSRATAVSFYTQIYEQARKLQRRSPWAIWSYLCLAGLPWYRTRRYLANLESSHRDAVGTWLTLPLIVPDCGQVSQEEGAQWFFRRNVCRLHAGTGFAFSHRKSGRTCFLERFGVSLCAENRSGFDWIFVDLSCIVMTSNSMSSLILFIAQHVIDP